MGHMRFARPQRLGSRWSNVRRSVKTSPLCLHLRHNIELAADEVDGQEDCLYLDVSRPGLLWDAGGRRENRRLFHMRLNAF